jgi:homopolymeric O-antigen transport system ATP-binding protein
MLEFHNVSKVYCNDIDKERRAALREIFWKSGRGAHLRRGEILAIDNISFAVEKGRPFLILGSAGSGKTAIARLACGLSQPSNGVVKIEGTARLVDFKGISATPFMSLKHYIQLLAMSYGADRKDAPSLYNRIIGMELFKDCTNLTVKRMPPELVKKLNFYLGLFIDADLFVFDETFSFESFNREPFYRKRLDEIIKSCAVLIFSDSIENSFHSLIQDAMLLDQGKPVYYGNFQDMVTSYNSLSEIETTNSGARAGPLDSATGNKIGKILSVKLTDANGDGLKQCVDAEGRKGIPSTEAVYINILVNVLKGAVDIRCGVDIYMKSIHVFGGRQSFIHIDDPGTYESQMKIPANLLASNSYSVTVGVIMYFNSIKYKLAFRDCLNFRVAVPVGAGDIKSPYPDSAIKNAMVSPQLEWKFTGIANQEIQK